ncbi:efflux transporter periplasmic adaptor subunit [Pandoraea aquatica]|uniref:Efflux transporter periplasmic adaptor subunit n=1 Tax=Pandoraea aquatica TaxID=2508290 RepID=A0A5E4X9C8_9BURK|nr:efflux RND transporter periplasmic adaptor subunit [Pandoraea aquatica]VVE32917.1 efflux transporter periplasmic adaptor subunit [Pandoraea aquatica]
MHVKRSSLGMVTAVALAVLTLAACGKKPQQPQGMVPEVGVVTLQPQSVTLTTDLPGRTAPYRVADVRARVDGIVLKRDFTEGGDVKAGQRLYKIDPATYQAAYENAKATLAKAVANQASTKLLADRYKQLVAVEAVSKQDYDNAVAAALQADADVQAGKAAVDTAKINLGYTDVPAPISGRTGLSQVTEGAYVQSGAATLMTTVQQIDPMYVDVTQSAADGLRLRRALADGKLQSAGKNAAKVELTLEDGTTYPLEGKLQFSDITVDQTTGSVTVRAIFPNPNRELLPGMFVHAKLQEGVKDGGLLVPQQGVTRDQKGQPTALIVNKEGKIELRQLVTDRAIGDKWLVSSGLAAGDQVIVSGLQKARPGSPAKAVPAQLPGAQAQQPAGASAPAAANASGASQADAASSAKAQ